MYVKEAIAYAVASFFVIAFRCLKACSITFIGKLHNETCRISFVQSVSINLNADHVTESLQ